MTVFDRIRAMKSGQTMYVRDFPGLSYSATCALFTHFCTKEWGYQALRGPKGGMVGIRRVV